MGENWKYYDAADFSNWKRKQGSAYKIPPRANFLAAANHIRNVLEAKKINWAVMGGLAMLCLGSRREMPDLHLVYDDKEFSRVKAKLESDRRVRMPKSMNPLFPSKLLVSTGPKHKDAGCTENAEVEVDLVPPVGTPSNDILRNSQVMLRLNQGGQAMNFRGLNMLYLVKTTLHYCKSQDVVWDARKDLIFLCRNYGKEIGAIRSQLNVREVQKRFLGTGLFSKLSPEDQRACYEVLLGKDPPPAMSLTPAPPQDHREAPSSRPNPRPQITSHKSSPTLNTTMQQQSNFLIPPLPGKSKPRPAGPTSPPTMKNSVPPNPQHQGAPKSSSAERDARSRYRTSNSAPNTPSSSRNASPETRAQEASRPKSVDMQGFQQPTGSPKYRAHTVGVQNVAHVAHVAHVVRPQVVNNTAPSPTSGKPKTIRLQKSLPEMIVNQTAGIVPVYAHGQGVIPPMPRGPANSQQAVLLPAFATSPPHSRRDLSQKVPRVASNQSSPRSPAAHKNHPPATAELPSPPHHPRRRHLPQSPTQGLPSNHPSDATREKELRLIGPEGLYAPLPQRCPQVGKGQAVAPPVSTNARPAPSTAFVFELDASSPQFTSTPPVNISQEFVAELPAEVDGAGLTKDHTHHLIHMVAQGQQPHSQIQTQQHQVQAHPHPQPPQEQQAAPPKPHTLSNPLDALPSSLIIGGPGKRRPLSKSVSQQAPLQLQPPVHIQTFLAPESNKYAPNPNRVSMYKAYSAPTPASPPRQPATAPTQLQQPPPSGNIHAQVPVSVYHNPASAHDAAPLQPIFMQGSAPTYNPGPSHVPVSTYHMHPPFVLGSDISNTQQQSSSYAPPLSTLRAGPAVEPLIPRHLLPNPVGANPPTPPSSVTLAKHDSQQSDKEYANANKVGAVAVATGAGVLGAADGYAAYAHQHPNLSQHQHSKELRYDSQHLPRHAEMYEQSYQQPQFRHGEFMPTHQRKISSESNTSTTSHDSEKLAMEYQTCLPHYGSGYGNMKVYQGTRHDADNETIYDFT